MKEINDNAFFADKTLIDLDSLGIQNQEFRPYHNGGSDPVVRGHPISQWREWFLALARMNAPGIYEGTGRFYSVPFEKCGSQGLNKAAIRRISGYIKPREIDLWIAIQNNRLITRPRAQHRKPEWL